MPNHKYKEKALKIAKPMFSAAIKTPKIREEISNHMHIAIYTSNLIFAKFLFSEDDGLNIVNLNQKLNLLFNLGIKEKEPIFLFLIRMIISYHFSDPITKEIYNAVTGTKRNHKSFLKLNFLAQVVVFIEYSFVYTFYYIRFLFGRTEALFKYYGGTLLKRIHTFGIVKGIAFSIVDVFKEGFLKAQYAYHFYRNKSARDILGSISHMLLRYSWITVFIPNALYFASVTVPYIISYPFTTVASIMYSVTYYSVATVVPSIFFPIFLANVLATGVVAYFVYRTTKKYHLFKNSYPEKIFNEALARVKNYFVSLRNRILDYFLVSLGWGEKAQEQPIVAPVEDKDEDKEEVILKRIREQLAKEREETQKKFNRTKKKIR